MSQVLSEPLLARWQAEHWPKPLLARWRVEPRALMENIKMLAALAASCLMSNGLSRRGHRAKEK